MKPLKMGLFPSHDVWGRNWHAQMMPVTESERASLLDVDLKATHSPFPYHVTGHAEAGGHTDDEYKEYMKHSF